MKTYTKDELIDALREIRSRGFIPCARENNHGGIGNTLEDLLGISQGFFCRRLFDQDGILPAVTSCSLDLIREGMTEHANTRI